MSRTKPVSNIVLDCVPAGIPAIIDDDPDPVLIATDVDTAGLSVVRVGLSVVMVCRVPDLRCV